MRNLFVCLERIHDGVERQKVVSTPPKSRGQILAPRLALRRDESPSN
jgi:hypothetical protein